VNSAELESLKVGRPCGKLIVKLATSDSEREAVFRLRYQVFNVELGEGIPENEATGMDVDSFDRHCDHLMILNDNQVIGTYRLLFGPRRPESGYYSQTEYDLSGLQFEPEQTVELGRACVHADHRKQTTLMALFWGVHRYMMARNARWLLGCGSLVSRSNDDAEATFAEIVKAGHLDPNIHVEPLPANRFQGRAELGRPEIPPLISMYFLFGAKMLGRPAYDPVFRCFDLLLIFDMAHLSQWGIDLLERFDRRLKS
jgi:putative hemolysin